jgi:hypothetical protein
LRAACTCPGAWDEVSPTPVNEWACAPENDGPRPGQRPLLLEPAQKFNCYVGVNIMLAQLGVMRDFASAVALPVPAR